MKRSHVRHFGSGEFDDFQLLSELDISNLGFVLSYVLIEDCPAQSISSRSGKSRSKLTSLGNTVSTLVPGGGMNLSEGVELFCSSLLSVGLRGPSSSEIVFVVVQSEVHMEKCSDTAAIVTSVLSSVVQREELTS